MEGGYAARCDQAAADKSLYSYFACNVNQVSSPWRRTSKMLNGHAAPLIAQIFRDQAPMAVVRSRFAAQ